MGDEKLVESITSISVPDKVNYIINKLIKNGYEAYMVGGCVRDSILSGTPKDWDITTSAQPARIKELFRRTIDTGIKHGTVTVIVDKEGFEVTTYRIDGRYEDKRRPKDIAFTTSLLEDLKRRDFTINAMAYNETEGLVDNFCGMEDIKSKIIRCVGLPDDRFEEDALRILRAVRFSAQLDYKLDEKTKEAIIKKAPNLQYISAERIQSELNKIVLSPNPDKLKIAYETGITKIILPEFDAMMQTEQNNPFHVYNVGEHTIKSLKSIRSERILRWTMLLHDIAKPVTKTTDSQNIDHFYNHPVQGAKLAKSILKRLKFDNHTIENVERLIRWHDYNFTPDKKSMRKAANKIGADIMDLLFEVQTADTLAKNPEIIDEKLNKIENVKEIYKKIKEDKECIHISQLAIGGNDLIDLGIKPGIQIGKILNKLLEYVIEEPQKNNKEQLIYLAKEYFNNNL